MSDLDALVAEKVMGWRRTGDDDYTSPQHEPHLDWESKGPHPRLESPDGEVYYLCACRSRKGIGELPPFSTDRTAAEQVELRVWELRNQRALYGDDAWVVEYDGQTWQAGFKYDPSLDCAHLTWRGDQIEGDTAALAICRAALAVVGVHA